ncbi:hypothetical protein [Crassaminicella indica]|uniref:Lipoprotein n=1 Tax=Crassaminicella indica TaxID=2855394 RepID=A0ABX8RAL0_9CLOT|nr:hypothetical protein [Crassaminicella indica]QXM05499.1 hypothetical protein KVH43_08925 [Crassaminicella indica]
MKKIYFLGLLFLLAILICSCTSSISKDETVKIESNNDIANNSPSIMKDIELLSDEELLFRYVGDIELACPDLNFESSSDIASEELFDFFLFSLWEGLSLKERDEQYQDYYDKWFNAETNSFHIPSDDITEQLNKYFKDYSFDLTKVSCYNPSIKKIEVLMLDGWGGDLFPKIQEKHIDHKNNRLKLIVSFFMDDQYTEIMKTKSYIFEFYSDKGYYLIQDKKI